MNLYARIAGSQLGSSLLFGSAFFAATVAADGIAQAAATGSVAAAAWFGIVPLLRRAAGGQA